MWSHRYRHQAVCLEREPAVSGRSRVYNHVRPRRVGSSRDEAEEGRREREKENEEGPAPMVRGRPMMVCAVAYKNRKGNPGTRPTAYYLRHRNARPCDRPMMLERTCVSGRSLTPRSLFFSSLLFHSTGGDPADLSADWNAESINRDREMVRLIAGTMWTCNQFRT